MPGVLSALLPHPGLTNTPYLLNLPTPLVLVSSLQNTAGKVPASKGTRLLTLRLRAQKDVALAQGVAGAARAARGRRRLLVGTGMNAVSLSVSACGCVLELFLDG